MRKIKVIDIILWIIVILFLINTSIACLSYEQLKNNKEPTFKFSKKVNGDKITYDEGLYKVYLKEDSKMRAVSLKLFFLG